MLLRFIGRVLQDPTFIFINKLIKELLPVEFSVLF